MAGERGRSHVLEEAAAEKLDPGAGMARSHVVMGLAGAPAVLAPGFEQRAVQEREPELELRATSLPAAASQAGRSV